MFSLLYYICSSICFFMLSVSSSLFLLFSSIMVSVFSCCYFYLSLISFSCCLFIFSIVLSCYVVFVLVSLLFFLFNSIFYSNAFFISSILFVFWLLISFWCVSIWYLVIISIYSCISVFISSLFGLLFICFFNSLCIVVISCFWLIICSCCWFMVCIRFTIVFYSWSVIILFHGQALGSLMLCIGDFWSLNFLVFCFSSGLILPLLGVLIVFFCFGVFL